MISTEGSGQAISFIGAPLESTVEPQLKLTWDHSRIAKGLEASFSVTEMKSGAALAGAKLLIGGVEVPEMSDADGVLSTMSATAAEGSFTLQAVKGDAYSPVMTFKVAPYTGTAVPRNVNVTMGEAADTSRRFTWQTEPLTAESVVEVVKQADFAGLDGFGSAEVQRFTGTSEIYNTNNDGTMRVHKAEAAGLVPGTAYVYRVGDGAGNVSGQGTFVTSGGDREATKLLFIGDSQADSRQGFELWKNTVQQAFAFMPDAEMLVHAGDMVDKGFEQEQWNWWFEAAQEQLMNTTQVPIIGNHEVMGTGGAKDYLAQFNNPQNGAAGARGTSFSFDIKDTHFVVLDSEQGETGYLEQAEWLDADLSATDKKWKVLFFHQGPYGSIYANERAQKLWVPVFDKHNVDLVMNGHDHIYMRSYAMNGGQQAADGGGTRYVIGGSSGPKFYALTERSWQEKIFDEDEQIYTGVVIGNDGITVTARTVDGKEIDRLVIGKAEEEDVITSITLQGQPQLQAGASDQTVTRAVYASGAQVILTEGLEYASSNHEVATVDSKGQVEAHAEGTSVISVTYGNLFSSYNLTVLNAEVPQITAIQLDAPDTLEQGEKGTAVVQAVYSNGSVVKLNEGVTFSTSDSRVAEVNENGEIHAVGRGEAILRAVYSGWTAEHKLTVNGAEEEPRPEPSPVPTPVPTPDQTTMPGPGTLPTPVPSKTPAASAAPEAGTVTVTASQLSGGQNAQGEVVIEAGQAWKEVVFPGNAADLLAGAPVRIQSDGLSVLLPAGLLAELASRVPEAAVRDSLISLSAETVSGGQASALLTKAAQKYEVQLAAVSGIRDWNLKLTTRQGEVFSLTQFRQPVTLVYSGIPQDAEALTGIYYIGEDGNLEYVGGAMPDGRFSAEVNHFSAYAILRYDKSFSDLPSSHWAGGAVKQLAARQLVQGVSLDRFEPKRAVTRAEFAAMLVRSLGITGAAGTDFADVQPGKWYAEAVYAAKQAGIVNGLTESSFGPDKAVTRQEMASMLVRAYAYAAGTQAGAAAADFPDTQHAPEWAKTAIGQAVQLKLLQGQTSGRFAPEQSGTRAESAQMILNLLGLLK